MGHASRSWPVALEIRGLHVIEGVSKVELHDGTVIEEVRGVELLTGGALKVTRWVVRGGNTFACSTYVPPGLWKPFEQQIPTLVVRTEARGEFQVPGLAGDELYNYVFGLLKGDGADDRNADHAASNVVAGENLIGFGYGNSHFQFSFIY